MRVVVLGSSGLLGRSVTDELLARGHEVVGVSRSGAATPALAVTGRVVRADLSTASDAALDALLDGAAAAVHCLGPDDRAPLPLPVERTLAEQLVGTTRRVAAAAGRRGLGHLVVLGSYFTAFDRLHPDWGLTRHPYVAARRAQAEQARAAAGRTAVSVLEIPFVFGHVAGTQSVLKDLYLDRLRRGPVGIALAGGTAAVANTDVARAAAAVVEGGAGPGPLPLAVDNLTYRRLSGIVLEELGRRVPVAVLPGPVVTLGAVALDLRYRLRGRGTGLLARHAARDLLARRLYLDPAEHAVPLGLVPRSLDGAVRETVRGSYPQLQGRGTAASRAHSNR